MKFRKLIRKVPAKNTFVITKDKKSIKDDEYLPFSFTKENLDDMRDNFLKQELNKKKEEFKNQNNIKNRTYEIGSIMKNIKIDQIITTEWYFNISQWDEYVKFLEINQIKKFTTRNPDIWLQRYLEQVGGLFSFDEQENKDKLLYDDKDMPGLDF